jgi:hypothetical protein
MKAKKIHHWTWKVVVCAGGCMTVAATLLYQHALAGSETDLSNAADDLLKEPALLDSFSEPSVACALLKQEADRLLLVYSDKRNLEAVSQQVETPSRLEVAKQIHLRGARTCVATSRNPPGSQIPEMQALLDLDQRVCELHLDLSRKALKIYLDEQLWDRFVDRYLQIVGEWPDRWEVRTYFADALECAEKCGRAKELASALGQLSQAHPELRTFADAVPKQKAPRPQGSELARR